MALIHGGQLDKVAADYDIPTSDWLDLSTGIAPTSYPIPNIPENLWQNLPQSSATLIESAKQYYQCENIFVTNGSQAIIKALPLLCQTGDDTFTVVNGDVFTDFDFSTLPIELPQKHAHLVMVDNPVHNPAGDFCFKDKRLLEAGADKLTFSGVACYHSSFFAGQKADVKPLAPMLRTAIKDKLISAQHYKGQWTDVGTPERLAELNMTSTNQE